MKSRPLMLVLALAGPLALGSCGTFVSARMGPLPSAPPPGDAAAESWLIRAADAERSRRGLRPLAPDARLTAAARSQARSLSQGARFSHTGRDGSSPTERARRAGYPSPVGENIALAAGPAQCFRMWMESSDHRRNLLSRSYRTTGVGVSGRHFVQVFGL